MELTAKRFMEVLEEEINRWEEVATSIDNIVPILTGDDQKQQWREKADKYRAHAKSLRAQREIVRGDNVLLQSPCSRPT